jgi:DNA-binding PadR family transcriptional regulator
MARTDLIALAEEFEEKARALRLAHELLTTHGIATARKNLPATLRAATKLRGAQPGNQNRNGDASGTSVTQRIVDLLAAHPAGLSYREITAQNLDPTGALTYLNKKGLITKTPFDNGVREVFRYALTEQGKQRATGPEDASSRNGNGNGHHSPSGEQPGAVRLQKGELTAFLLRTVQEQPKRSAELVAALQAAQHPIENGSGIVGPLSKLTHTGWLVRGENGIYRITAKGRHHLDTLQQQAAPPAAE